MSSDNLYEQDFIALVQSQAELLRLRKFEQLDLDNLIEELECLIHTEQNLIRHHAYRLWYYLLTEKYEGFKDIGVKEWHSGKAGYHHSMLESFLESPQMMEYFRNNYLEIYQHVARNWCCDRGDWEKTLLPREPPIPLEKFLEDGNLYWLLEARKEAKEN